MKLKKYLTKKTFGVMFLLGLTVFGVWYYQLSNRHKAIVKTKVLHTLHIIDPSWEIDASEQQLALESPSLLVDNIYQSMDGPQAILNLTMNSANDRIQWVTGFKAEVFKKGTTEHNNDYLCHTNIDYYDATHYKNLLMPKRINTQYPRLGTLSNGINELNFPEGFGFPVASEDAFIIASRTLNHNIDDAFFQVKHRIKLKTEPGTKMLKPLLPKGLVLMLPYDLENPYNSQSKDPNFCTPIDLKNHSGPGQDGTPMSVHWELPLGKTRYEFDVTYQLRLKKDTRIHAMAAHLHPGAELFQLYDVTAASPVYSFDCINYTDKVGLKHVPTYSSQQGILLKADHVYKLVLETDNPSTEFRDMMAVLFVYLYDKEMELHLEKQGLVGAL